ncbi:MAG: hypothetical protein ABR956_13795 [Terracidiphilus sp.]
MLQRSVSRFSVYVAAIGLIALSLAGTCQENTTKRGRKYKAPLPTARIEVTVLKDVNGKAVENAAVVFHPMAGEKDEGNMELKTNEDGKALIDVLPIGDTVRLQVIAHGYQTYGEDYKVDKPELAIEIRLKRPGEQYSIYKMHDASPVGGKSPSAAPATPVTPPSGSGTQSGAQNGQAQPK